MTTEGVQKTISELKVSELRAELEKRGLDKNGIKAILTDRLEKALKSEGHDPSTFLFPMGTQENVVQLPSPCKVKEEPKSVGEEENGDKNDEKQADDNYALKEEHIEGDENINEDITGSKTESGMLESTAEEEQLEDPLNEPNQLEISSPEQKKLASDLPSIAESDPDRMFWVRGIAQSTKAAELKDHFSKFGRILRAKIFTSKSNPFKTFGLVTVYEPETVDACIKAQHNKPWNGNVITIDKGTSNIKMSSKMTAAANVPVTKKDSTNKPTSKDDEKTDEKKQEKNKNVIKSAEIRSSDKDKERDRARRDADRNRSRREPIREPHRDSRKTITAARHPHASAVNRISRAPLSSRLSRPTIAPTRRVESYGRSDLDRDRNRDREEELRRRAAQMELESEKQRLRAEREKLERERLEVELLKQRQQLAVYKSAAHSTSSRSHRDESRDRGHTASSRRPDDKYSSTRAGDHRIDRTGASARGRERGRERAPARIDDRRPPPINPDRSRSRHDTQREPAHRESRYVEPRREARHETSARAISSSYASRTQFSSTRDAPANTTTQNYFGSREPYANSGASSGRNYDHGARVAPATESWGGGAGNWTSAPTDSSWGTKNSGSTWGSQYNANPSSVRMDYEKYHRQRQQF